MSECGLFSIESLLSKNRSPKGTTSKDLTWSNDVRVDDDDDTDNGIKDNTHIVSSPTTNSDLSSSDLLQHRDNADIWCQSERLAYPRHLFSRSTATPGGLFRLPFVYPPAFHGYVPGLAPVFTPFEARSLCQDTVRNNSLAAPCSLNLHKRHIAFLHSSANYNRDERLALDKASSAITSNKQIHQLHDDRRVSDDDVRDDESVASMSDTEQCDRNSLDNDVRDTTATGMWSTVKQSSCDLLAR